MPDDDKKTRPDLEGHAAEAGPPSWHPPHHTPPPLPLDPTIVAPTEVGRRAQSTAATAVPRRIGRYAIRNTLGRGGMGVVYLAYDASLDREIALKVIPAGPDADPTDLARFQAEAETAARLHHPNIVPVYEVGKTDDVAYMAMEFVPGGNLHSHLTKAPPTPTEAARLVEQLARGVQYAHDHGVIHRDLKPSNVLLTAPVDRGPPTPEGSPKAPISPADLRTPTAFQPTPKIADFGLAKRVDRPLHLTRSGVALGTPNYMAPEQARGLSNEIGPAADIHALGAILYELLVGFPPFGGGTPMETMHQVVHKTPVAPGKLRHGIPPALEQICVRCLEKHPRKRYATAGALADALEAFRTGGPASDALPAPPSQPQTEYVAPVPRRRLRVLVPAAALALVVAAAGLAIWLIVKSSDARVADAHAVRDAHTRAAVEAAIAQCEAGHLDQGIARLKGLEPTAPGLPVADIVRAWEAERLRDAEFVFPAEGTVLALSPDGTKAAVATGESVQVWAAVGGQSLVNPTPAGGEVTALGWDETGQVVAIGTKDGKLLKGDLTQNPFKLTSVAEGLPKPITAVESTEAGVRFTAGDDPTPRTAGAKDAAGSPDLGAVGPVDKVAFHPRGEGRAAVTATGGVRLFDKSDGRWHDLPPDGHASAIAYSSDGNVLAVGTKAGAVRLWDAIARVPLTQPRPTGSAVAAVGVRPAAGAEYEVLVLPKVGRAVELVWSSAFVGPPIRLAYKAKKEVLGVAFAPGGTSLFVTSPNGVSRWDVRTGVRVSRVAEYGAGTGRLTARAVHHGADTVLVAGTDGRVALVKDDGHPDVGSVTAAGVTTVAAHPTGSGRVTACGRTLKGSGFVRHWPADMKGESREMEVSAPVLCQAYLPDGSGLVLGCEDGSVHVWDPAGEADARAPFQTGSPVLCVAARRDWVLAGCADGTARVWDLETGAELVTVRHRSEVRAVAFHDDQFLTAGADGALRRWHITGLPIGPARHHADAISALDVHEDMAATGGRDRYVRVWRLP